MKRIILSIGLLLLTSLLYSQEVFRLGVVEGDSVAYQVRVWKIPDNQWLIRNMDNPDTTLKPIPQRAIHTAQETDMDMQIAEIIHDNLSEEDLSELKNSGESLGVILRANKKRHNLLQVTCFCVGNYDFLQGRPYRGFWLNFNPDLYKIEREIVERVVLPEK